MKNDKMNLTRHTYAEQPEVALQVFQSVKQHAWKCGFVFEDDTVRLLGPRLENEFADYQFVLRDADAENAIVAVGHCLPFYWDAPLTELPARGWDAIVERAIADRDAGREPNTLTAIEVSVAQAYQGKGVSRHLIESMRTTARQHGFSTLVAPVRPSLKASYPLTPMERYVAWTTADQAPFDPWIRTHWRLGARIVKVAPQSMRVTGTIADWERWTQLQFPDSGDYVVPGALAPITIDRERDQGIYIEPNVWMQHAVT